MESKVFEYFMVITIIVNSALLASQNYEERINPSGNYLINTIGTWAEYFFFFIFLGEFILKVIAMGVNTRAD